MKLYKLLLIKYLIIFFFIVKVLDNIQTENGDYYEDSYYFRD